MALLPKVPPDRSEKLQSWLSDSPFEWGSALATRTAIRCLPLWLTGATPGWLHRYALPIFHSLFVAWSTHTSPVRGHKLSAELSANLLKSAALSPQVEAFFASGVRAIALAIASKHKNDKAYHSTRAIASFQNLARSRQSHWLTEGYSYDLTNLDVENLENSDHTNEYVRRFLARPVVPADLYHLWFERTTRGIDKLINIDPDFEIWKPWLLQIAEGRIGNKFEVVPNYISSNRELAVQIIQNLDEKFWERPSTQVNNDLRKLTENLTADPGVESLDRPLIPPQNDNAISFYTNEIGKIEISPITYYESVRNDQDTHDRYDECLANAREALERCRGSNSATRFVAILERYLEALSTEITSIRPSLLVQRGERLRQEIAACQAIDSMLPPIPDGILLELKAWQTAHNMLVGLDPALVARDTAQLGPDIRLANVPPQEIRDIANDAENLGLLAENVAEIVIEAANLAPGSPDPLNRKTIWSFETGRNLIIEAFNLALKHPAKAMAGTIVSSIALSTAGFGGAVIGAAAGAYPAAKFLLSHRRWIETRLGDTPTWQGLFVSLCEWLEENTPPGGSQ